MTAETSNARGEWVLVPREPTAEMVQASDEISCRAEGAEHWAAMLAAAPQPAAAEPVAWQFQGRDGEWRGFMDERHRQNTIADGSWPVRALYAAPPSASVGVDEAAAIRAFEEHFEASSDDPYFEGELELWLTAWRKALAAQHQEPKS